MIKIGRLNKKIEFLCYIEIEDELGQSKQDFKTFRKCWADFYPVRDKERYEAERIREELQYKCYVRYFDGLNASNFYIKYKDRLFKINSVIDIDGEGTFYELYCTEYIKGGE